VSLGVLAVSTRPQPADLHLQTDAPTISTLSCGTQDDELALQFSEDAARKLEIPDVDGWLRFRLAVKPAARRKLRAGLEQLLQMSS